ncbi:MAG: DMT family transporter [Pelagibacterium sp.]|jgi:bacterial/archaeal transporter family-2 protein|uniref:DMT family transporter n=1 Tax=Pelagibacterium sp. TaxID=1967288 RepID=UPI0032EE2973|tara:strand:- start:18742 stop:19164 length:423 start_codon:yes stop_codon:yes gene_type:complete
MTTAILFALLAGILVSLSRQLNGRLALSTTALIASYWNHVVGFAVLTVLGLILGGLWPEGALSAPWYAYLGGTIGVVFVASGSWLIARIGAINTAMLVIGGQMISGVLLDLARGNTENLLASAIGVTMIIAGMALTQKRD